jgi:hypothetical protein
MLYFTTKIPKENQRVIGWTWIHDDLTSFVQDFHVPLP